MYRVTGDQEQLENPYRPMTPAEEEIMMIYEDGLRDQEVSRYKGSVSDQGDPLWNQQQNQMILSSETLLIVD